MPLPLSHPVLTRRQADCFFPDRPPIVRRTSTAVQNRADLAFTSLARLPP